MTGLLQDVRYSLRSFAKSPGFVAVAVLTLGLGIGANTALFSVVNRYLINPLPFADAGRIVSLHNEFGSIGLLASTSVPDHYDYRAQKKVFDEVASLYQQSMNLMGVDRPERIRAIVATAALFPLLGMKPVLGRAFTEDEERNGAKVAVIDEATWRGRFGGSPDAIGKQLRLNGDAYTIIGVVPSYFSSLMMNSDLFIPANFSAEQKSPTRRGDQFLLTVARSRPERRGAGARAVRCPSCPGVPGFLPRRFEMAPEDAAYG